MARPKKSDIAPGAVAVVEMAHPQPVEALIADAVKVNASIETMERLFSLREKVKTETAREEFVKALGTFQSQCPIIEKTKRVMNKDGKTVRYMYAPLDAIVKQIGKPLQQNGLAYRWDTRSEGNQVTATCIITHTLGHSESSSFTASVDTNEYMSSPQRSASSITFAKRQALCNALGIATGDEDDDANSAKKEPDAKDPRAQIMNRLRALNQKTGTKEDIQQAVLNLTKLALVPTEYSEIITRLDVLIQDRNENDQI